VFYMCPDSGTEKVRNCHGRPYSNEELLKTVKLCARYHIPVTCFFSIGLAGETGETIGDTFGLCNDLFRLEKSAMDKGQYGGAVPLGGPITSYVFLDPGSLAFDFPEKYGYKPAFLSLEEYIEARNKPSWHQWLNYETELLNRNELAGLIIKSMGHSTDQRELYGAFTEQEAAGKRLFLKIIRFAIDEVENIERTFPAADRERRLTSLADVIKRMVSGESPGSDTYGYHNMLLGMQ
jgi:radical SAM superfamily enzyme YgiQ (UPF0313 family)